MLIQSDLQRSTFRLFNDKTYTQAKFQHIKYIETYKQAW